MKVEKDLRALRESRVLSIQSLEGLGLRVEGLQAPQTNPIVSPIIFCRPADPASTDLRTHWGAGLFGDLFVCHSFSFRG